MKGFLLFLCAEHGTNLTGERRLPMASLRDTVREYQDDLGTVKYYAQIHLQFWQNSVCTGQGNLPLIT